MKLIEPFLHQPKDEAVFLINMVIQIRFGIYELVTKCAAKVTEFIPTIAKKNLILHTIKYY